MSRFAAFIIFLGICALAFAFFYQPRSTGSRFGRLGYRIRTVAYAYVLAIIISAALRLVLGWGS